MTTNQYPVEKCTYEEDYRKARMDLAIMEGLSYSLVIILIFIVIEVLK